MKSALLISILVPIFLFLGACAPVPTPPTATTPQASTPLPVATAQAISTLSPEDAVWQRVVEAAKQEGQLVIYTYWGADTNIALQRRFKEKYGITSEFIVRRGAEHLESLKTEKRMGKMVGDVYVTGAASVVQAQRQGFTTSLSELPVLKEKDVWVVPPDTYPDKQLLYVNYQGMISAINTKLVSPAGAPRSVKDLITPAWKGRMMATSPSLQTSFYYTLFPFIHQGTVDMNFIKALGKQDISFQISNAGVFQALARGERPFAIDSPDSVITQFIAEGAPIKPLVLEEGLPTLMSPALAVVNGAPHPNAARLFTNWLFSREGHDVYSKYQSYHSIRKDVPDYSPQSAQITAKKLINITPEMENEIIKMFNDRAWPKLWEGN